MGFFGLFCAWKKSLSSNECQPFWEGGSLEIESSVAAKTKRGGSGDFRFGEGFGKVGPVMISPFLENQLLLISIH